MREKKKYFGVEIKDLGDALPIYNTKEVAFLEWITNSAIRNKEWRNNKDGRNNKDYVKLCIKQLREARNESK